MAQHLPFVMQQLFNTPMLIHQSTADMIISAVSGRLNITSLEHDMLKLDARGMRDLAAMGRAEVDARKAKPKDMNGAAAAIDQGDSFLRAGPIAVVPVYGTLKQRWGVGPYSGATGYDGIKTMVLDAANDPSVKATWLDISSGGGAVDGLFDLCDLIEAVGEKAGGKPVWAMAADRAYSAAFAIGTSADKLFVPETGGVGSVGVITMLADMTKALDNQGIAVKVIRYPDQKALASGPEEIDPSAIEETQAQVKATAEIFQDRVARNMGISKKSVADTRGLDYMGDKAKVIGFASDVLSETQAWAKLMRKVAS